MSTRGKIGILNESGSVLAIYNHFDSYPEGIGSVLIHSYMDINKVRDLISFGAMSCIGPEIGEPHNFDKHISDHQDWCLFYGRDRGDSASSIQQDFYMSEEAYRDSLGDSGSEYLYLFKNGDWWVSSYENHMFKRVRLVLEESEFYEG